ncbi:recombinase family protein [Enterococcus sp. BWR-S5]|uniref:recombinase family protein n=1 Tax=Enterococcus sp. BWR-S5 TaxID=2787714 RepID=UPI001924B308|nr:recombinase family protein [Enterococcus sp. BWR-S5]MBL1224823.1 recombinase family protein [Enterococcus sp. BWR-S5]
MKKAALYMRVSTDQQAKHGDSLREQQDTLNDYVKSQNDITVFSEYIDDGISGQKLERDEFTRLMNDVIAGNIDIILFTKLDRWFRNLRHYLNTQEILEKNNVSWNAVSQQYYDTSTAYGRTFIAQVMSFAELEAQIDSERIKAVAANKIRQGEVVSGKVPLGYSIENKRLVINDQAEIVKAVFSHYLTYNSMRETVRYMDNELGIQRDYQSVKNMLTNKKYIGEHRDNKEYCPPIITRSDFERVQELLKKNVKRNTKRTYLFSGLIKCSECGKSFSGQSTYQQYYRKSDNLVVRSSKKCYRCSQHRNNSQRCSNKKIYFEDKLEAQLLETVQESVKSYIASFENSNKRISKKNDYAKKIENKIERLKKAYLNEVIDLEEYKTDRATLVSELEKIELENSEQPKDLSVYKKILSNDFINQYSSLLESDKKIVWRSIIRSITVDIDGNIDIIFL